MNILIEIQFLPPVQFFSKFSTDDRILLDDMEIFQKQSYRNRCRIAGANNIQNLIIPLKQGKTHIQTKEVEIDNSGRWQREHWHSIKSAYGKSPYFEHYSMYFEAFFKKKYDLLWDFDLGLLKTSMKLLKIPEARLGLFSEHPNEEYIDFRNHIHPKEKYAINDPSFIPQPYSQTFMERTGFIPNLSVIDLIFNKGRL